MISLRKEVILQKIKYQFQAVMDFNSDCRKRKGMGLYFVKGNMEKGYPQTEKHWQENPVVCSMCLSKSKRHNLWSCSQLQRKRKLKRLMKELKKKKNKKKPPQLYSSATDTKSAPWPLLSSHSTNIPYTTESLYLASTLSTLSRTTIISQVEKVCRSKAASLGW